jgi:hypothetical protein
MVIWLVKVRLLLPRQSAWHRRRASRGDILIEVLELADRQ